LARSRIAKKLKDIVQKIESAYDEEPS